MVDKSFYRFRNKAVKQIKLESEGNRALDLPFAQPSRERMFRTANGIAFFGLIFFAVYYLTAFRFDVIFNEPARQVDFTIWRFAPNYIFEYARYPAAVTGDWEHAVFQYLPSAAAMMLPLSWPSQPVAFAVWLLIEVLAFVVVLWIGLRLSGALRLQARWLIMIAAVLLSENSLGWDFRNHNTNIVYLALVMLGLQSRRTWVAALLLALSINFKLYSGLVPIALVWRREYALSAAICVWTVLVAVLMPIVVFGPSAFLQLAADWIAQISYSMAVQSGHTASLIRSVAALLGVSPDTGIATVTLLAIQAAWLAMVVYYYIFAGRAQPSQGVSYEQARLADVCVALIAPLPLSIWFIPYHAVVMLPAYMLLLTVAVSADWPKWLRVTSGGACLATLAVRFAVPHWDHRGAMFLASFMIMLLALGAIRRPLARRTGVEVIV